MNYDYSTNVSTSSKEPFGVVLGINLLLVCHKTASNLMVVDVRIPRNISFPNLFSIYIMKSYMYLILLK